MWYNEQGIVTNMALYENGEVVSADINFLSDLARELGLESLK